MKELSIEEKAKAYDEALEKAKNYHSPETACNVRIAMENLFPELKESEDERIRREIIDFLRISANTFNADYDNWIAWLEKQGECHISHDDKIMIKQLTEYFTTGHGLQNTNGTVVEWLNDVKEKLEKQGEQKPATMSLDEAIKHCKEKSCGNNACALEHKQLEKWLIELKELKEQKPAEWSEEDREMRLKILRYLSTRCNVNEYEEAEEWLKSLRPQKRWKPSDRELGAILTAIGDERQKGSDVAKELLNIYQHLKKLREK